MELSYDKIYECICFFKDSKEPFDMIGISFLISFESRSDSVDGEHVSDG